jgi:hypothetical protein
MNTQSLGTEITKKLELLPESKLQSVLHFVNFLASRVTGVTDSDQTEATAQIDSESLCESATDAQLESINGVLVLKAAKEPIDKQALETLYTMRERLELTI